MKLNSKIIAISMVIISIGGISLSTAMGWWNTESRKIPARYITGDFEGTYNPADIRGSYSFNDIAVSFPVPVEILAEAFAVDDRTDPGSFQLKELEEMYDPVNEGEEDEGEIGTDSVRLFVALYAGLPYAAEETTRLPAPAMNLLKNKLAPADLEAFKGLSVSLSDLRLDSDYIPEEHDEEEAVVKGNTSFADLISWGISREELEEVLGIPIGQTAEKIRDFLIARDMEFSVYKLKFQEILDQKE
jgi:hypothetical protein